jgi:hypothetical protein
MADLQTYGHVDILRYLQHRMSPQEMHDFEKALMNDPFLADALEGYLASDQQVSEQHIGAIENALTQNNQKAKVVYLSVRKKEWWKIAAVFIIIVSAVAVTISVYTHRTGSAGKGDIAAATPKGNSSQKDNSPSAPDSSAQAQSITESPNRAERNDPVDRNSNMAVNKHRTNFSHKTHQAALQSKINLPGATSINVDSELVSTEGIAGSTEVPDSELRNSLLDKRLTMSGLTRAEGLKKMPANSDTAAKGDSNVERNKIPAFEAHRSMTAKIAAPQKTDSLKEPELTLAEEVVSTLLKKKNPLAIIVKDSIITAEPVEGWDHFQQYISRQLDSVKTGEGSLVAKAIELEFSLDPQGRPTDIKAVTANDKSMAAKIIQLFATGPLWKNIIAGKRMKITIQF